MKCTAVLLGLAATVVAVATAFPQAQSAKGGDYTGQLADPALAAKQKAILQLLVYVQQPTIYAEIAEIARKYDFAAYADHYANAAVVKRFADLYKQGTLPKGEIFHIYNDVHLDEAIALFDLFYFANDFETFYKTAAWARENFNEGQFVYAFSVAVLHRPDSYGLQLPPFYEIYPYYYLSSTDMQTFVNAKLQGYNQYYAKANFSGLYDVTNPEQFLSYFTEDVGLNAYHAYTHLYHPFWMSSQKYGFSNKFMRGESFYYYYQQLYAKYSLNRMSMYLPEVEDFDWEENNVKPGYYPALKYHSGQAFPARPDNYPLSSIKSYSIADLKAIEYRIKEAIDSGYVYTKDGSKVSLFAQAYGINILGNIIEGNKDSVNNKYYGSYYAMLQSLFALIMDPQGKHGVAPGPIGHYETALRDPAFYVFIKYINEFFFQYKNNLPSYKSSDLYFNGVAVKDVEVSDLVTYFDYFDFDVTYGINVAPQEANSNFNYVAKVPRLNHLPFSYKVKVVSDKATNAVVRVFLGPKAEQLHSNFFGDSNVEYFGHDTYDLDRLRYYFVELDRFPIKLNNGQNVIERKSQEFTSTVGDHTSFKQLLQQAEKGNYYFKNYDSSCGFPDRLALPLGHISGMPYSFFVMVTPYGSEAYSSDDYSASSYAAPVYTTNAYSSVPVKEVIHDSQYPGYAGPYAGYSGPYSGYSSQYPSYPKTQFQNPAYKAPYSCNGLMVSVDNKPLGFPFDREIQSFNQFYTPNMYFKDVYIYHKNSTEFQYGYYNAGQYGYYKGGQYGYYQGGQYSYYKGGY